MGRWRRKKHYYQSNDQTSDVKNTAGNHNNSSERKDPNTIISWNDKKKLIQYLQDYKSGAERVRKGIFTNNNTSNNNNHHKSTQKNKQNNAAINNHSNENYPGSDGVIMIGTNKFTALTDIVLSQPLLELPKTLSGKDRRFVHETCVDVGLYHCGIGSGHGNRYVIVSIYADGFSYLDTNNNNEESLLLSPKMQQEMDDALLYRCKPWFCQNNANISVDLITRQFKQTIESLIDQPSQCLRDDYDTIDYKALEHVDLYSIPPPKSGDDSSPANDGKKDSADTIIVNSDIPTDDSNKMNDSNNSDWMLVDTADKMKKCVQELTESQPTEIAFDLEAQNVNKYTQRTCLLQITSSSFRQNTTSAFGANHKEYIIDPLAPGVWNEISGLAPLFANPSIVKIGHSIGSLDVRSLHRDFGIFVVNAFDTYEAARMLGLPHHGLNDVCHYYGMDISTYESYSDLKANYQVTDWRIRPLTHKMIYYARCDVHYLFALRTLMMRDLTRKELYIDKLKNQNKLDQLLNGNTTTTNGQLEAKKIQNALSDFQRLAKLEDGSVTTHTTNHTKNTKNDNDDNDNNKNGGDTAAGNVIDEDEDGFFTPESGSIITGDGGGGSSSGDLLAGSVRTSQTSTAGSVVTFQTSREEEQQQQQQQPESQEAETAKPFVGIATAKDLRMNANLMAVITTSLERSKDLWSSKPEPHMKNSQFKSTLQRQLTNWTPSHMTLYEELVELRNVISTKEQCLPGFVCTLDFLVHVAAKRPTNVESMQKINYFLPDLLLNGGKKNNNNGGTTTTTNSNNGNDVGYLEKLLELVKKSRESDKENNEKEYNITHHYDASIEEKVQSNATGTRRKSKITTTTPTVKSNSKSIEPSSKSRKNSRSAKAEPPVVEEISWKKLATEAVESGWKKVETVAEIGREKVESVAEISRKKVETMAEIGRKKVEETVGGEVDWEKVATVAGVVALGAATIVVVAAGTRRMRNR